MAEFVTKIRTDKGDLPIDYNALANKPELNNMFSNPNLLINSDFRNPINQRGNTIYNETTERYGVDRWLIYNGVIEEVKSGCITLRNTLNQTAWFGQHFEFVLANNESYVITVNVGSITGNVNVCMSNMNDNHTVLRTLKSGINTFVVAPSEMIANMERLIFTFEAGAAIDLVYVKLERGTTPTPFVGRLYDDELMICRRYYRKYWTSMLFPQFYSNQYCGFVFDTPMRRDPTVKTFSILSTNDNSSIGTNVEVYAQGVYKFYVTEGYAEKAILVPMLELDAEIYH